MTAPPEPPERPESVTVSPHGGTYDTLWHIAEELFEDGSLWPRIYAANRDVLDDPDAIRPGMTLRLPMEIYPDHLRSVAHVFDVERGELAAAVRQAAEELNAIGDFWGGDKLGTDFFKGQGGGTGYEAVSGRVMEGVEALLEAHEDVPARLRLMADRVQVADWDSVAAVLSAIPEPDEDRPVWGES
ncbi:LysM peptidoglycan-binding domain-containing protein [Nonomuraea sp. NPDC000554]|uniref:LysM peptidoglycan-binding domain-containing protein n=1 Tax=Nonomuraea sp. NPDC000554 TaxID=3154259 RepID=UPI0033250C33